ncbi:E3 ubiquitin-protein ligase RSL1-like [Amaranthus tricolor]|uniref:E3 ubiquitin-protein ligase RSL1-like n=1 Tax=Amaranthus tricolor TaxID=29722 RepID=UPI002584F88C|nr:E3 ubiquitin-protein ligase RSL1-like [Amaranthus tricolor]
MAFLDEDGIDLFVDEAYLLALINEEPIPISDEKYALELTLQEAIYSSSSFSPIPPLLLSPKKKIKTEIKSEIKTEIKTEYDEQYKEMGESSKTHLIFCGICMEHKSYSEIFMGLSKCTHTFCIDCVLKYMASKINENIGSVKCPDPKCKQVFEPEKCSSILPKEIFERWENALFEAMIPGYQKFYCPYKDCSALMVDDGGIEVRSSECPSCKRLFCARCQVRWHEGITCEEFDALGTDERDKDDVMVFKMAKDNKWRRCPNCRIHIEKTQGCQHMSCSLKASARRNMTS